MTYLKIQHIFSTQPASFFPLGSSLTKFDWGGLFYFENHCFFLNSNQSPLWKSKLAINEISEELLIFKRIVPKYCGFQFCHQSIHWRPWKCRWLLDWTILDCSNHIFIQCSLSKRTCSNSSISVSFDISFGQKWTFFWKRFVARSINDFCNPLLENSRSASCFKVLFRKMKLFFFQKTLFLANFPFYFKIEFFPTFSEKNSIQLEKALVGNVIILYALFTNLKPFFSTRKPNFHKYLRNLTVSVAFYGKLERIHYSNASISKLCTFAFLKESCNSQVLKLTIL